MADIDSIISGVSGNTRYDFSSFGDPVKTYFDASDQKAKRDLRDAFKGGVPTNPDGSIDYGTMQRTFYQKGAFDQGNSLAGINIREGEQRLANSVDGPAPSQPIVGPSTSRNSVTIDPSKRADAGAPQGPQAAPQGGPQQQGGVTPASYLEQAGIQPGYHMEVALAAFKRNGIEPDQPFNPNDPAIATKIGPMVQRLKGVGQVQPPQPGDQQQVMAQGQPSQPDPYLAKLTRLAGSQDKQIAAAWKARLEAYQKNKELTPDQKNAAAAGQSLTEYQDRPAEAAANLAILKDSIIPKLDLSHKSATAARDEISAIHRSREQLDTPGGIFSGGAAEIRLKVAKIAELVGVPNADKIANTEAFSAAIGSRVLELVKGLGAGTSISNADRSFAQAMAGGNINLDEKSIRRILDIGERAARSKIELHNSSAGKIIKSNEALAPYKDVYSVETPGPYESKKAAAKGSSFDAPKQAPDGNFYVPDPARPGKYLRVVQ